MITVIGVTGQASEHEEANGVELTTYEGTESPQIRLLRAGWGLPGGEVRYRLTDVERLMVPPDVEVGTRGDYAPVAVVGAPEQGPQAE